MKVTYDPQAEMLYIEVNTPTEGRRHYTLEAHDGIEAINADYEETSGNGPHLLLGLEVFLREPLQILTSDVTGMAFSLPMVVASSQEGE